MALKRLTYFGSYCWGDAMYLDEDKIHVHGWKPYWFDDNEVAAIYLEKDKEKSPVYLLQDVDWQRDPKDMFFAKAKLLGYVPTSLCVANGDEVISLVFALYNDMRKPWFVRLLKKLFSRK